ncbi:alpha/beta fold hydrolase [Alteromonas sp. ASW11-130]|uniref:alpha/beta fold hydrolase n=1 Tax=Alteromonas sp. ASW11-130 TaxID=3015775 RepID=UPI00224220AD|nr:alpha/beta hydrolase [Alteromonas sp. ASW11-130]MCW8092545.1 alpha/beta hydrolase [Alteromonas sp. ASW11-130]
MFETEFHAGRMVLGGLENRGQGKTIIGLHGYLDNAASLSVLAPFLHDYQFISLDMAGHGRSSHRPHGAHYNQIDYVQDLHAFFADNDFGQVILMGHSLGGIVATIYAALFPEKIDAVISLDACGPLTKPEETTTEQLRESVLSRFEKTRNRLRVVDFEKAVNARCKISDISADNARLIIRRNLTQDASGHCFWASDPRLRTKSSLRMTEKQAENLMKNIRCPVWFGAASKSFKELRRMYEKREPWFSQSQLVEYEGGHHIHMEQTEAVATGIKQFVEQL